MRAQSSPVLFCLVCMALGCGCSEQRKAVARYEGIDPAGEVVQVKLYVPPFVAATPVCMAPDEPAHAEMQVTARPPGGAQRETRYLSRRHHSHCGADKFASMAYWETTLQGPELCLYRPAVAGSTAGTRDVIGAWDYCTRMHPARH